MSNRRKTPRIAIAGVLAASMLSLFAAVGGVGVAQSAISAVQYQYGHKVTICHKGKKSITVAKAAVPAHLRHGDVVGTCAAAAKANAAKAEATKVEAAKEKAEKAEKPEKAEKAEKAEKTEHAEKGDKPGNGKGRGKGK